MNDVWLIEFRLKNRNTCYHLAADRDAKPLCGRTLRPDGVVFHVVSTTFAIRKVKQYNVPGGRNGINGCSDCYHQRAVLQDPVTRLGDLARADQAPA
jgi:hypothetical protein